MHKQCNKKGIILSVTLLLLIVLFPTLAWGSPLSVDTADVLIGQKSAEQSEFSAHAKATAGSTWSYDAATKTFTVTCPGAFSAWLTEDDIVASDPEFAPLSEMEHLVFADGVTDVTSASVYGWTALKDVTVPAGCAYDASRFYGTPVSEATGGGGQDNHHGTISGCTWSVEEGVLTYAAESPTMAPAGTLAASSMEATVLSEVTTLVFSDNITSVPIQQDASGNPAFPNLETVIIGKDVTSLTNGAFNGFTKLAGVDFSSATALETISGQAFRNCTSLTTLDLRACESLVSLNDNRIILNSGVETVYLPASCTSFGSGALACSSLKDVYMRGAKQLTTTANPFYWSGMTPQATLTVHLSQSLESCTLAPISNAMVTFDLHGNYANESSIAEAIIEEIKDSGAKVTLSQHDAPAFTWNGYESATAEIDCSICGEKATLNAPVTSEVTKEPTCTEKGVRTYTATAEGSDFTDTKTEEIDKAEHTPGAAVQENQVESTCTAEGSYDEVVYCSACNAELSRKTVAIEMIDHTPSAAVHENRVEPTYATAGSYDEVIRCSACNAELSRKTFAIDKLKITVGSTQKVNNTTYKVTSANTVTLTKAANVKSVVVPASVKLADGKTYRVTAVGAKAFTGAKTKSVTIGKNVAKIAKNAFKGSKAKTVTVKSKKIKKNTAKGCLKGSKVNTVKVKVGAKAQNKKYVKAYKAIFTKKNCGRAVAVK